MPRVTVWLQKGFGSISATAMNKSATLAATAISLMIRSILISLIFFSSSTDFSLLLLNVLSAFTPFLSIMKSDMMKKTYPTDSPNADMKLILLARFASMVPILASQRKWSKKKYTISPAFASTASNLSETVEPGFLRRTLKPVRNLPVLKAFLLSPDATSHCLNLFEMSGLVASTCQFTSFDTYWNVFTSLSMPSLFARKITSLSTESFMVAMWLSVHETGREVCVWLCRKC